jgi:hypothetical protein
MLKSRLIAFAILLSTVAPAIADDAIFVVRPPTMQMRANVLPQNAFQASATTPASPTPTTPSDDFMFKSALYDSVSGDFGMSPIRVTVSMAQLPYEMPRPKTGSCDVGNAKKVNKSQFMWSNNAGWVSPYAPGKYGLTITCDTVQGIANGIYYNKVLLTVTP